MQGIDLTEHDFRNMLRQARLGTSTADRAKEKSANRTRFIFALAAALSVMVGVFLIYVFLIIGGSETESELLALGFDLNDLYGLSVLTLERKNKACNTLISLCARFAALGMQNLCVNSA